MFRYILQRTLQNYFAYLGSAEYIFAVIYFFSNTPSTFFFLQQAKRKSHLRGLVFGFAQSMPFFAYAGCMYYGGYLVDKKELAYQNVFK